MVRLCWVMKMTNLDQLKQEFLLTYAQPRSSSQERYSNLVYRILQLFRDYKDSVKAEDDPNINLSLKAKPHTVLSDNLLILRDLIKAEYQASSPDSLPRINLVNLGAPKGDRVELYIHVGDYQGKAKLVTIYPVGEGIMNLSLTMEEY